MKNYNRNVLIFDGAIKNRLVFKKEFSFTDEYIRRDITSNVTSTFKIFDEENVVQEGDLLYIPKHLGISIFGIIKLTENDEPSKIKTITFNFGCDVWQTPLVMLNNSIIPVGTENNKSGLWLRYFGVHSVTATDQILDLDVALRQMYRAGQYKEESNFINSDAGINNGTLITYNNEQKYEFSINDTDLTDKVVIFSNDTFNTLRLYNSDNRSQFSTYYLADDGQIYKNDVSKQQYPVKMNYESVLVDEWDNLDFASSKIRQQEYGNVIEFTIPLTTNIKALEFNNSFLSRQVKVHFKGFSINTMISAYELVGNTSVKVKLGLTRSRLTDILRIEKEKNK